MGFSNYFIYYFIRRFLNMFFNKKRLKKFAFFIIVFVVVIFILHTKGYCDYSYTDSLNLSNCASRLQSIYTSVSSTNTYLNSIYSNTNTANTNLSNIVNRLDLAYSQNTLIRGELDDIELYLNSIDTSNGDILNNIIDMQSDIASIRNIISVQMPLITQTLNLINTTIQNESDDIQTTLNNESDDIQTEISQDFSDLQELLTQYMFGENYDNQTYSMNSTNSFNYSNAWGTGLLDYTTWNNIRVKTTYYELPHSDTKTYHFKLSFTFGEGGVGNRVAFANVLPQANAQSNLVFCRSNTQSNTPYSFDSNTYGDYKYIVITQDVSGSCFLTGDYNEVMEKGSTQSIMDNQSQNAEMLDNTITDSSVNAPFSDLPSDTTQDITESGFTNVFDTIRTTFTSGVARDLVVPIPFTGKSFTINTGNVYGNANFGLVGTLITAFWYFAFSLFIAKDISKKINMIKSGNLENIQSTNIKEDLL